MAQTFKTYDGVEVEVLTDVWFCFKGGINENDGSKDIPTLSYIRSDGNNHEKFYYFSTPEACQAYIDEVNKPTPNGTINTTPTAETKPLVSRNSARLDQLIAEANKPVESEPTPIIVPSDNYFQLYVSGGESTPTPETHPKLAESLYHPMLTDFAKFYGISPNTVFEFIINQKSNQ